MPQAKLSGFFRASPRKVSTEASEVARDVEDVTDQERKVKEIVAVTSTSGISKEEALLLHAEEVGVEFVKNGSRDRWGQLRQNIGGRPPKRPRSPDREGPEEFKQNQKSHRKRAGCGGGGAGGDGWWWVVVVVVGG